MSMSPMSMQEAVTGMPSGRRKKTRRGGRKQSAGKPGAQHHAAMNQAYAQGNYAQAKTHALNFANAMHAHAMGMTQPSAGAADGPQEPDGDDMGASPNAPQSHTNQQTGVISDPPGMPDSGHWISGAIQHPGALHRELGVPQGQTIPAKKIQAATQSSNPTEAKRARLAQTLKKMRSK